MREGLADNPDGQDYVGDKPRRVLLMSCHNFSLEANKNVMTKGAMEHEHILYHNGICDGRLTDYHPYVEVDRMVVHRVCVCARMLCEACNDDFLKPLGIAPVMHTTKKPINKKLCCDLLLKALERSIFDERNGVRQFLLIFLA